MCAGALSDGASLIFQGDTFESKPKRLKQNVQDVDMYAKNKQVLKGAF